MPARNAKGQFLKRGSRSRKSVAVVRRRSSGVTHRRRRRHGGVAGGSGNVLNIAISAAVLAYAVKNSTTVAELAGKIPGNKTFGGAAAVGLACLAVDRFAYKNKWLKLAGVAGVVLAATQLGTQGTDFKYVGDVGDADDDIIGDYDEDDIAYDDVGDYDDE